MGSGGGGGGGTRVQEALSPLGEVGGWLAQRALASSKRCRQMGISCTRAFISYHNLRSDWIFVGSCHVHMRNTFALAHALVHIEYLLPCIWQ